MQKGSIFDFSLWRKIFRWVDWCHHSLDSEERRQVGSVRRYQYQGKEPPHRPNNPAWDGPRWDVTPLLHKRSQRKPQRVQDAKIIGHRPMGPGLSVRIPVFSRQMEQPPLVGRETGHREKHDADADVTEYHAHPDLLGEGVQEAEDAGVLLDGLLYHDWDSQGHERLAEVYDALTLWSYRHRCYGDICFLKTFA